MNKNKIYIPTLKLICLFVLLISVNLHAQLLSMKMHKEIYLSKQTEETSALIYFDNMLWTLNDSGNEPAIYEIDKNNGDVIRKIIISNAVNIDWEALAFDEHFIYIGDVGDNNGKRKQLTIYRIARRVLNHYQGKYIQADSIILYYPDKAKTRSKRYSAYDCEAMYCYNDSLFLISKNWRNQNQAQLYASPSQLGNYTLSKYATIESNGLICDAAFQVNHKTLAVVGYRDFMPFISIYHIGNKQFKLIANMEYPKYHGLQTEGICYLSPNLLILSCEKNRFYENALYCVNYSLKSIKNTKN